MSQQAMRNLEQVLSVAELRLLQIVVSTLAEASSTDSSGSIRRVLEDANSSSTSKKNSNREDRENVATYITRRLGLEPGLRPEAETEAEATQVEWQLRRERFNQVRGLLPPLLRFPAFWEKYGQKDEVTVLIGSSADAALLPGVTDPVVEEAQTDLARTVPIGEIMTLTPKRANSSRRHFRYGAGIVGVILLIAAPIIWWWCTTDSTGDNQPPVEAKLFSAQDKQEQSPVHIVTEKKSPPVETRPEKPLPPPELSPEEKDRLRAKNLLQGPFKFLTERTSASNKPLFTDRERDYLSGMGTSRERKSIAALTFFYRFHRAQSKNPTEAMLQEWLDFCWLCEADGRLQLDLFDTTDTNKLRGVEAASLYIAMGLNPQNPTQAGPDGYYSPDERRQILAFITAFLEKQEK